MRKIILSLLGAAMITVPASHVFAAPSRHHTHHPSQQAMRPAASDPFRNAQDAIEPTRVPNWSYSGWSAPAGR